DPTTQTFNPVIFNGGTYTTTSSVFGNSYYAAVGYNRDNSLSYVLPLGDRYHASLTFIQTYNAQSANYSATLDALCPVGPPVLVRTAYAITPEDFNTTQELHLSFGGMVTKHL